MLFLQKRYLRGKARMQKRYKPVSCSKTDITELNKIATSSDDLRLFTKAAADGQTANGSGTEPTGTDLSDWVSFDSTSGIGMTLAEAAAYRTSGASKATPGF